MGRYYEVTVLQALTRSQHQVVIDCSFESRFSVTTCEPHETVILPIIA